MVALAPQEATLNAASWMCSAQICRDLSLQGVLIFGSRSPVPAQQWKWHQKKPFCSFSIWGGTSAKGLISASWFVPTVPRIPTAKLFLLWGCWAHRKPCFVGTGQNQQILQHWCFLDSSNGLLTVQQDQFLQLSGKKASNSYQSTASWEIKKEKEKNRYEQVVKLYLQSCPLIMQYSSHLQSAHIYHIIPDKVIYSGNIKKTKKKSCYGYAEPK